VRRIIVVGASILITVLPGAAAAQGSAEFRTGVSNGGAIYRYIDYNFVFHNKVVVDAFYIGVPGQNELYFGLGYQIPVTKSLTVTPMLYEVTGKEGSENGLAIGAAVIGSVKGLNVNGYICHFEPVAGSVPRYSFMDTLDISKKLKRWEAGGSGGFFYANKKWNPLIGPVIMRNDERGSWKVHLRGGATFEARLTRSLTF